MGIEFVAKFLDIDKKKIIKKLLLNGGSIIHKEKMYNRTVFYRCNQERGFTRVRDEGDYISLTTKFYKENSNFAEENEVIIKDSYENVVNLVINIGLKKKHSHETLREKWSHPLAHEITFDTVPGIPTYLEIDGSSEENLNKLIELLELDKSKMRFKGYDYTYEEYYGIDRSLINSDKIPSLSFSNIINEIKPTKNADLLKKIYLSYSKTSSKKTNKKSSKKPIKKSTKKSSKKPIKKSTKKSTKKSSKKPIKKSSKKKID